jgi:V-type H+-transporting ATPase S1 subunit
LQLQPFSIKGGKFSYAYDCVGFFSIPILMGLFTTGLLLMILFFGIMAVFSITTMDRFDDPKGSFRSFGSTTG